MSRELDSLESLNELRHCRRCDTPYLEINNLGAWKCRYHPGDVSAVWADRPRHTWTCCGAHDDPCPLRTHADTGCVKCDHVWEVTPTVQEERQLPDAHVARLTLGKERLAGRPGVQFLPHVHRYVIRRSADDDAPLPAGLEPPA